MTMDRPDRPDRLERVLARWLAVGTTLSTGLLAVGLAGWMVGGPSPLSAGCMHGGLLVLMATPVVRVLASVVEYARERDWAFVATTLAVLAVLTATLVAAVRTAMAR
jgi:uncharacterized membrane protein